LTILRATWRVNLEWQDQEKKEENWVRKKDARKKSVYFASLASQTVEK